MSRSKLGPLPDEVFEHDVPDIPNADKAYSPAFHSRMDALSARVAEAKAKKVSKGSKPGDQNSEEFHAELLGNEDAEQQVVAETVSRMKARGLSQEALDLAYGRPKK